MFSLKAENRTPETRLRLRLHLANFWLRRAKERSANGSRLAHFRPAPAPIARRCRHRIPLRCV